MLLIEYCDPELRLATVKEILRLSAHLFKKKVCQALVDSSENITEKNLLLCRSCWCWWQKGWTVHQKDTLLILLIDIFFVTTFFSCNHKMIDYLWWMKVWWHCCWCKWELQWRRSWSRPHEDKEDDGKNSEAVICREDCTIVRFSQEGGDGVSRLESVKVLLESGK